MQVVQGTTTTGVTVASVTPTDSGITATITPTLSTSKVLVFISATLYQYKNTGNLESGGRIMRGATAIVDWDTYKLLASDTKLGGVYGLNYLDSPATNSATTYKLQIAVGSTANGMQITAQPNSAPSSIILMEIGA